MRVLLDTNIVLDALACRTPFNRAAEQIFLCCENKDILGYLSANSITDIYYLLRKHISKEAVRLHMRNLMLLFGILPVGEAECALALNSHIDDFEDAIQAACAKRSGIDYIITRDSAFIHQCTIAITPAAFLNMDGVNA